MKKCSVNRRDLGEVRMYPQSYCHKPADKPGGINAVSLEEVIKHPAHLFSKQPFPHVFQHQLFRWYPLHPLCWSHQGDFRFLFLMDFSHFLPVPTLIACLKPPSPPSDAADSSSDVSSLAPRLRPCPDLGIVLGSLAFSECHMAQAIFHWVILLFAYWIWNQTWIWAVRGSGILFFPIFGIWKHIVLCVKRVFFCSLSWM